MRPRREGGWAVAKIEKQAWLISYNGYEPEVSDKRRDDEPWATLAGPITVTFDVPHTCPHCGGALPEAQDKAEPPKELVVEAGGTYRTRNGERAELVSYSGPMYTYAMRGYVDEQETTWTVTGEWNVGHESQWDLVERLS